MASTQPNATPPARATQLHQRVHGAWPGSGGPHTHPGALALFPPSLGAHVIGPRRVSPVSSVSAKRALRFPASWDQRGRRVAWRATWEGATWPCVVSQLATSPKHHALQACQPGAHLLQPHHQEEGLCLPTAHGKPGPLSSPAQGAAVTDVCNTSVHELATPPLLGGAGVPHHEHRLHPAICS